MGLGNDRLNDADSPEETLISRGKECVSLALLQFKFINIADVAAVYGEGSGAAA